MGASASPACTNERLHPPGLYKSLLFQECASARPVHASTSDSAEGSSSASQIIATSRSPATASPLSRLPNSSVSTSLIAGITCARILRHGLRTGLSCVKERLRNQWGSGQRGQQEFMHSHTKRIVRAHLYARAHTHARTDMRTRSGRLDYTVIHRS